MTGCRLGRLLWCLAAWFCGIGGVWAQSGQIRLIPVSEHSYYVEGLSELGSPLNRNYISNAGVVIAPDGVVVIDALGSVDLARQLIGQIRQVTTKPITHVIVTHYHADHIYGLQAFRAVGAQIIAQEKGRLYLTSDTAQLRLEASRQDLAPWVDESTVLQPADLWVSSDFRLKLSGWEFDLLAVGPAHTPDDLVVYLPQDRVLFAGDLVFRGRIPFVGTADSAGWIKAIDRLLSLDAQVVVPGHGPYSREPLRDLRFTRDYLQFLRDRLTPAAKNLDDFEEVYRSIDWSPYERVPLFKEANRMNAYNVFLSIQQE